MKLARHSWLSILLSAAISAAILVVCYVVDNSSVPRPDELKVLRLVNKWKLVNRTMSDNVPDSLLFVNVCYDKQMVDYYEDGFPVGQYVITDRGKLLRFLSLAAAADSYRYIMLDVFFERGMSSPQDSALFALISAMPRLVVAAHGDVPLQDSSFVDKTGVADYNVTVSQTCFSRFQFLQDGRQSMPLRMYADLHGRSIARHGLFFSDGHRLCHNAVTLRQPILMTSGYSDAGDRLREKNYLYLGADVLEADSIFPVAELIRDKIVVVGDFNSDRHSTYAGSQPGSVICANAYNALCCHDHYVHWWFVLFLFCLYGVIAWMQQRRISVVQRIPWAWLRTILRIAGVPTLFLVVALVAYLFDIVYNFYIPTLIYWLVGALGIYLAEKQPKEENSSCSEK